MISVFHGQEWERYCCFLPMIFDVDQMIAQLLNSSPSFSTMPQNILTPPKFSNIVLSPLSSQTAKIKDSPIEQACGALYFSDTGKIYLYLYNYLLLN